MAMIAASESEPSLNRAIDAGSSHEDTAGLQRGSRRRGCRSAAPAASASRASCVIREAFTIELLNSLSLQYEHFSIALAQRWCEAAC